MVRLLRHDGVLTCLRLVRLYDCNLVQFRLWFAWWYNSPCITRPVWMTPIYVLLLLNIRVFVLHFLAS